MGQFLRYYFYATMTSMYSFIRTLSVLCLLTLAASCATLSPDFDKPVVEVVGLQPIKGSGLEARFRISLRIVNPNEADLQVKGIYYELDIQGSRLMSGASSEAATVPGYGEAVVELEGSASVLGSLGLIRKLMTEPPKDGIDYELSAKISLGNMPRAVRVKQAGRIGAPKSGG
jgi:LEA14-like dessication related protein